MIAQLQITKRFYKDSRGREFKDALVLIAEKIVSILEHGPSFETQLIKPLSHTTKGNIWRIRANIQPAPYRLFFEWVKTADKPILRLITFVPKKDRICHPKHTSELDEYSTNPVCSDKHQELESQILRAGKTSNLPRSTTQESSHDTPYRPWNDPSIYLDQSSETLPEPFKSPARIVTAQEEALTVEPADSQDFISIYASKELIHQFASLQSWSASIISSLQECKTTEEACELISSFDNDAEESFIEFLIDESSPNDLERLYQISSDSFKSIAEQPLSSFMLNVDPDQQSAIDRPFKADRPYMVRGSAGTGKSIVCLYRFRKLLIERNSETLFDQGARPSYLFVSYTNALVNSSKMLFEQLTTDLDLSDIDIKFITLDKEISHLAQLCRDSGYYIPHFDKYLVSTAYWKSLKSDTFAVEHRDLLEKVGVDFFSNEVEEILAEKNITSLCQYLEKNSNKKELRKGLIISLSQKYRTAIWKAYEVLLGLIESTGKAPLSIIRQYTLEILKKYPDTIPCYQGIVADEIQDFGETHLKILVKICEQPGGLMFASDVGQTIFRRRSTMSKIDKSLRFNNQNSVILKRSYRMTQQIYKAILPLRQTINKTHDEILNHTTSVFSGNLPVWIKAPTSMHHKVLIDTISEKVCSHSFHFGQFAVLFMTNSEAKNFHAYCEQNKLPAALHTKDKSIDPECNTIHLLTIHSSKGLEFPHILIPFANRIAPFSNTDNNNNNSESSRFAIAEEQDSANKLLYVACSRAAQSLTIIQETNPAPSPLDHLQPEDWVVKEEEHS